MFIKKISFLSVILSSCLFSQTLYTQSTQAVNVNNKDVGFVTLMTPVDMIKKGAEKTEVVVRGFVQESYQEKLVKSPSLSEEFFVFETKNGTASYEGETNPYIKIIEKTEDEYGEVWLKAEFKFELDSKNLVQDPKTLYSNAKGLFEQTCSACHVLHEPNSYTVNQWPSHVESMISSGFVGFEPEEKNAVIKYLQHNAKDAK